MIWVYEDLNYAIDFLRFFSEFSEFSFSNFRIFKDFSGFFPRILGLLSMAYVDFLSCRPLGKNKYDLHDSATKQLPDKMTASHRHRVRSLMISMTLPGTRSFQSTSFLSFFHVSTRMTFAVDSSFSESFCSLLLCCFGGKTEKNFN